MREYATEAYTLREEYKKKWKPVHCVLLLCGNKGENNIQILNEISAAL